MPPSASPSPEDTAGAGFRAAAGALLHPLNLFAIAALAVNDHVLKGRLPGWFTGKASDVAGLLFFPFLLESLHEAVLAVCGRYRGPSLPRLAGYAVLTAVGFTYVKCASAGAVAYGVVLGHAQWLLRAPLAWLRGEAAPAVGHPTVVQDETDLVALLALLGSVALAARRTRPVAASSPNPSEAG